MSIYEQGSWTHSKYRDYETFAHPAASFRIDNNFDMGLLYQKGWVTRPKPNVDDIEEVPIPPKLWGDWEEMVAWCVAYWGIAA